MSDTVSQIYLGKVKYELVRIAKAALWCRAVHGHLSFLACFVNAFIIGTKWVLVSNADAALS